MTLVMALAYLYQVAPHDHGDHPLSDSYPPRAQHANHTHDPGNEDHQHGRPYAAHHHHSFAQHLDHHFLRICPRDADPERILAVQAPAPMQRIIDCPVAEFTSLFFDEPPEKPVPPNAPKRAPPA